MKYLIDTNILIILLEKSYSRLSSKQLQVIKDVESELYISEGSLYEIGIKIRQNKPDFAHINVQKVEQGMKTLGIKLLKSKKEFYYNIPNVPVVYKRKGEKHGDPFDLLIISQALVENLPTVSTDEFFPDYKGLNVVK